MSAGQRYARHSRTVLERALAYIDRPYPPGWCLRWAALEVAGVPPVADWSNPQASDAATYWAAAAEHGQVVHSTDARTVPAGALMFWVGGQHGHAAISAGDGQVITTDLPRRGRVGQVAVEEITAAGFELVGWVQVDHHGYVINRPTLVPVEAPSSGGESHEGD